MRPSESAQSVLLVDDSAFFPQYAGAGAQAAGYKVRVAPMPGRLTALALGPNLRRRADRHRDARPWNGFEFAETSAPPQSERAADHRNCPRWWWPAAIERGRQAGFHDYVANILRKGGIVDPSTDCADSEGRISLRENQSAKRHRQEVADVDHLGGPALVPAEPRMPVRWWLATR